MRDWLKGMFGGSAPAPDGIPENWVGELKTMLAEAFVVGGTNLSGKNLDDAVEFVLRGTAGNWTHPVPPRNPQGYISYNNAERPEQPAFYAALGDLPGDLLLRWAQVLESMAFIRQYSPFQMIFPGAVHWPEIVLMYGSGSNMNVYPPKVANQRIAYSTLEKMLVAAGMDPQELLVRSFATPVDVGYNAGALLLAVSHCPDYADALDRHIESLRPHLLAGSAAQRVHVLGMMARAAPRTVDKLAHELAELSVASSKQVRMAAESFVQSAGGPMIATLRQLAVEGKPEQRQFALRHLFDRGRKGNDPALCDFARTTAAADKAASVQALPAEWDTAKNADEAPEAKYDYQMPVIDWSGTLDAALAARLDKLWEDINALILADNQRSREYYERHSQQHGKPQWKLHQNKEISSSWLKELKSELDSGKPPGKESKRSMQRVWVALPAVHNFATDASLEPTQLWKVLHFLSMLFDHRSSLNNIAVESFNRMYAANSRPTLIEIGQMAEDTGFTATGIFASYCSSHGALARTWKAEDVWPFVAHHVPTIERYLLGLEQTDYWFSREMLYHAISVLPTPPPRIVNALFTVALGQGKSERLNAQEALANLPNKEARIIAALSDGKSEIRMVAAQWLGRLKHEPAIPALSKAVATEKHDTAKGAMLDALQILGEPVDKYLKRDALLPEAKKALAKPIPKDLDWVPWDTLPAVRWADNGQAVAPDVLKWMVVQACRAKSAEPNAVLRKYCAMFEPRDREAFGQWVLDNWLREDIAPIPAEQAHSSARASAHATHGSMKSHPQYYQNHPMLGKSEDEIFASMLPSFLRQPKGSAIGSKGILAVAASCAAERAAAPVARYIKEYYGTRAAQGKALITMLAWIEHPSATQVMLAIGNRFRTKSIQEEATRQAEALADRKGWTLAELADRTIPSAGFDENGELELSYGNRAFVAKLLPDFKIELFNPEGKKVASLSEPRQDDDADRAQESKKALSAAKKEIKNIVALQTDRLYEALCTGREWPYADWHDYLNLHPVVRHLAQRLIWLQYADSGVVNVFRPLDDGTLTNADDEAVTLPPDARVRLAHDSLLPREAVERWQQHLVDYEIKPLFQQLGKGTYELPPDRQNAKELSDFQGHLLEAYALRGRAGKLGYQRGAAEDGGWFHVYEKRFPTLGLTAVVQFTGSPLPEENRTVALINLSFSSS
ncbi:MAG TPA: DUF4132 domain-containing protein, partial [Steroidobacteraceae bacterium]